MIGSVLGIKVAAIAAAVALAIGAAAAGGVVRWYYRGQLLELKAEHDRLERERLATALADQRRQVDRSIGASTAYQADRAELLQRLRTTKGDLDAALKQAPASCPATVGATVLPGSLGVRLNAIGADGAASAAAR